MPNNANTATTDDAATTLLVGTASACRLLLRQLELLDDAPTPIGWVALDHDPGRQDPAMADFPCFGCCNQVGPICQQHGVDLALVTAPASMRVEVEQTRSTLRRFGVVERYIPPLNELLASGATPTARTATPARLDTAALVGRRAHGVDRTSVVPLIGGRRVLITGAGGSIGSELARVCAGLAPAEIALMERAENALFEIDRELAAKFPALRRAPMLHDVVDAARTAALVARFRPDVVFHAAAHKHVPMMEDHPAHAVTNNVLGTKAIADAAVASGADRFVLISSDKAVNPANVMGATKRLAETYVRGLQARLDQTGAPGSTRLAMVRFGNVLGSASSVLPIWSAQLLEGGPLTITDERMTRYFMTIPEAAALVVQAAALAGQRAGQHSPQQPPAGADVFVLDMGQPVRIVDLAERFCAAHGLRAQIRRDGAAVPPGRGLDATRGAVDVLVTGARPGEKLAEELAYSAERLEKTDHPGVLVLRADAEPLAIDPDEMISDLQAAAELGDRASVTEAIARWASWTPRQKAVAA